MKKELVIIGGGPAGMAAALEAREKGIGDILILERDRELGGILNQCIHNGFGLHRFKEELTGPEYALRYINMVKKEQISYMTQTMVTGIREDSQLIITAMGRGDHQKKGSLLFELEAKAVILAMGCRERARGALNIPGYRPSGVLTAGCAQKYVNREGLLPGRQVVVLGSGDIGLIMARRMKLQGADVKMVLELMPYSGGLKRNIVQCLEDFHIPLKLSHTVVDIDGRDRICGVVTARVDERGKPISGTEEYVACDTLLLSCGLIPENELSKGAGAQMDEVTHGPIVSQTLETTVRGVFACGNVLHVHDLVDHVSEEGKKAGRSAAEFILRDREEWGQAVRPKIPPKSKFIPPRERDFDHQLICIGCPKGCLITTDRHADGSIAVTGNSCPVGAEYAKREMTAPSRLVTSFIKVTGGCNAVVSVKTAAEIPRDKIMDCMKAIQTAHVKAPVYAGDILIPDVAGTGVDMIATADNLV